MRIVDSGHAFTAINGGEETGASCCEARSKPSWPRAMTRCSGSSFISPRATRRLGFRLALPDGHHPRRLPPVDIRLVPIWTPNQNESASPRSALTSSRTTSPLRSAGSLCLPTRILSRSSYSHLALEQHLVSFNLPKSISTFCSALQVSCRSRMSSSLPCSIYTMRTLC